MSEINPRNRQVVASFIDEDLFSPDHDKIMFWLNEWVKEPENITSLFNPVFQRREERDIVRLSEQAKAVLSRASDPERETERFYRSRYYEAKPVDGCWDDEPKRNFTLQSASWELPLHLGRTVPIGYIDMYCRVVADRTLIRQRVRMFDATVADENWQRGGPLRVEYTETDSFYEWATEPMDIGIFFEVKTEIRSVGELLRQLRLYQSSRQFEKSYDNATVLIVVAPPTDHAEKIVREQGFRFLQYPGGR